MRIPLAAAALVSAALLSQSSATASPAHAADQIRATDRQVLLAEYFGPSGTVCSHLTPTGVKSYTAAGAKSCTAAFAQEQRILRHKTKGVDDSGYTASQWRTRVGEIIGHLKVSVSGTRASAIGGDSGIPGRTTLVRVSGQWLFSSYPPSVES